MESQETSVQISYESMMLFAQNWIDSWNRRDFKSVLAHFADEFEFVSPMANKLAGRPVIRSKKELGDYWKGALERITTLKFKLDHATWDERRRELNVVYEATLDDEHRRACEIMLFDGSGRQIRGEALYGATI